jgi:flagellar biogenesis protein FliO
MVTTTLQALSSTMQAVVTNSSVYENSTSAAVKAAEVLPLTDSSTIFLPLKIFSFMILFIFVLVAYFYIKKKSGVIINKIGIIKEAERFYYNPKTFISVVKIGKEVLVVSVNETNTSLLTKIDDKEILEKIETGVKDRETPVFKDILTSTQCSFEEIKKKLKNMRQEDNEV